MANTSERVKNLKFTRWFGRVINYQDSYPEWPSEEHMT